MAKQKMYTTHDGYKVPASAVPTLDKKKDTLVNRLVKKSKSMHEKLTDLKEEITTKCDDMFEQMLAENNVKQDHKGGFTLTSYDKTLKIEVSISKRLEFDDRIEMAQMKINEYLEEVTQDSSEDIRKIINAAFKRTKGTLDSKRVFQLKSLQINHKLWKDAMSLIDKSISVNSTKRYFNIMEKDQNGEYKTIQLNFSSI